MPNDSGAARNAGIDAGKNLPRVLLLGDSISIGYTEPVKQLLRDVCAVSRPPVNCEDTGRGLRDLDAWLGDMTWDLIHFNWGLHDLCHRHPDSPATGKRDKIKGKPMSTPDQYRDNLRALVKRLRQCAARLVWASTTWVPPDEVGRYQGDEVRYNQIAAEVMQVNRIPINDLHALTASFPSTMFVGPGDVHFTEQGSLLLAEQVAACIRARLNDRADR
jgi:hypothetical protein